MNPSAIAARLGRVRPGEPQGTSRLQVIPLVADTRDEPEYRLLEGDALEKVTITEVDESGHVPVLKVHNGLDVCVFLMDGRELIGAKQNRILNSDVLVPASTKLDIPVSCVEQGRWRYSSEKFSPGKAASPMMRRRKASRVHESLKQGTGHDADQGEVWADVSFCLREVDCLSSTSALHDAYEARQKEIDELRRSFKLPDDAVGVAICRDGKFCGLDLFDRTPTMSYFWESLIDGHLLESVNQPKAEGDKEEQTADTAVQAVEKVIAEASTGTWETFDSPGLGEDCRMQTESVTGTGIVWEDDDVVHLQLFPRDPNQDERDRPTRRSRIHRRYLRELREAPGFVMPPEDEEDNDV